MYKRQAGRSAAVHPPGDRHSAAGGADLTGAVAAVSLLCRPVLGARCAHRKGRCAGHHLPGVPVSCAGKAGEKEKRKNETAMKLLELGAREDMIAEAVGHSVEEIKRWKNDMKRQ